MSGRQALLDEQFLNFCDYYCENYISKGKTGFKLGLTKDFHQ